MLENRPKEPDLRISMLHELSLGHSGSEHVYGSKLKLHGLSNALNIV